MVKSDGLKKKARKRPSNEEIKEQALKFAQLTLDLFLEKKNAKKLVEK